MTRNLNNFERLLRMTLGVGFVVAGFLVGSGPGCVLSIAGLIFVVTGMMGNCFIYSMLGISSYCPPGKKA